MKQPSRSTRTISPAEFKQPAKTTEETVRQIKTCFNLLGLNLAHVAQKLGCFRQVVYNQLTGTKFLSKNASENYAREFGFSYDFLRYGTGYMFSDPFLNEAFMDDKMYPNDLALSRFIRTYTAEQKNTKQSKEELVTKIKEMQFLIEKKRKEYDKLEEQYIQMTTLLLHFLTQKEIKISLTKQDRETTLSEILQKIKQFEDGA